MDEVAERLVSARKKAGYRNARSAADAFGWTYSTYAGHENGSRGLTREAFERYAAAFRVSPTWLAFGTEEPGLSEDQNGVQAIKGEIVMVPVYDISAAAGDGMFVDEYESIASRLEFPRNYLRHITTTNPEHLAIISVTGPSMLPTLSHDDIVMVDSTKKNIAYDGMFVVRHEGLLRVKRVRWGIMKRTIKLISDNATQHPEEEVSVEEVEIIGRVVWVGAKQP